MSDSSIPAQRQSDGTAAPEPDRGNSLDGGCHARLVRSLFSRERLPDLGFILWVLVLVSWGSEIVENRDRIIALEATSNPTAQSEAVLRQSPTSKNPMSHTKAFSVQEGAAQQLERP